MKFLEVNAGTNKTYYTYDDIGTELEKVCVGYYDYVVYKKNDPGQKIGSLLSGDV